MDECFRAPSTAFTYGMNFLLVRCLYPTLSLGPLYIDTYLIMSLELLDQHCPGSRITQLRRAPIRTVSL
jgi:hypothetical protein